MIAWKNEGLFGDQCALSDKGMPTTGIKISAFLLCDQLQDDQPALLPQEDGSWLKSVKLFMNNGSAPWRQ